ncbi:hypothetical protein L6V77_29325 [Myxococcota bacterium]|nr:hypothetical protein [Myxococcota bacterium]
MSLIDRLRALISAPAPTTSDACDDTAAMELSGRVFPHHGESLASPCDVSYRRMTLPGIRDAVRAETLRAGNPLFDAKTLALFREWARRSVQRLGRGAPDPHRLDDRAAVEELRRFDRDRHLAGLRADDSHAAVVQHQALVGAAAERATSRPALLWVATVLIGVLAPIAMTAIMYSTFVGTMAANESALADIAGVSRFLGGLSPVDQALATCLLVTGFASLVVTGVALSLAPMGVFVKASILVLEGSLAAALYFMRASAGPDVEAASMAYAAMELILTLMHGLWTIVGGARLRAAVHAQKAHARAEWDRDTAMDEEAHYRQLQAEADTKYRAQFAWYTDLTDQVHHQARLEAQAEIEAELAYTLALQELASALLGDGASSRIENLRDSAAKSDPGPGNRPNEMASLPAGRREVTIHGL